MANESFCSTCVSGRASPPHLALSVAAAAMVSLLAACGDDGVATEPAPSGPRLSICRTTGPGSPMIAEIFTSQLAQAKVQGGYVVSLFVDRTSPVGDSVHFRTIGDALAVVRAGRLVRNETETAACRITINVADGIIAGTAAASTDPTIEHFPLIIDVPDVSLIGALKMGVDAGGRATGTGTTSAASTFAPTPALVVPAGGSQAGVSEEIIIVNGRTDGPKGNGAVIEGFVFQSGRAPDASPVGGQGILSLRVVDLVIRGNRFEGGFTESIDLRASSALVERNHLAGLGGSCDICLAGPGTFVARDNRLLGRGGVPGIASQPTAVLPVPAVIEQWTPPDQALVTVTLTNNEVRGHLSKPSGVGLRVDAVGVGAPGVFGTSKVSMTGNTLIGNTFGITVHGGFPVAGTLRRGDVELTTSGNTISDSCQRDFLVTLSRHQVGLGLPSPYPSHLLNSTFRLNLGSDISWDNGWYSHVGGFDNTLVVNGTSHENGSRTAYDAVRVCP